MTQGSQTRSFVYDSLKRLTSATNPESGTISYQYDNGGNLTQKTDARGVGSTYAYDALNRNTGVTYTNDPNGTLPVTRSYDTATNGKGRLYQSQTTGAAGSLTTIDAYDALGRPLTQRQQFYDSGAWGSSYTTSRSYNLAGAVMGQTYPSGRTVAYLYDTAGRTASFTGNLGDGTTRTYMSNVTYHSSSQLQEERFGTTTPLYHKLHYNSRGQLYDIRVSMINWATDPLAWDRGCYALYYDSGYHWGGAGGQDGGPDNNGNVLRTQYYRPGDEQISTFSASEEDFTYDSLNRLTSVTDQYQTGQGYAEQFKQSYSYDRWGNRTIDIANTYGTGINNKQFAVNINNNQLTVPIGQSGTMSYDAAGNLTNDTYTGEGTRTYDAENRMTAAWANNQGQTYSYDADGRRVRRTVMGTGTWQIYGMDGELLAEYAPASAANNPQKEYGYRNRQLLVTAEPAAASQSTQNVSWTNTVGVSVSGNSVTKTAAVYTWGDSGASSMQSIVSGDGYVEVTASETTTARMVGLSHGDTNQDYTDIDFAAYLQGSDLCVYEGGAGRGCFGAFTAGDKIRVAVESGVVKYKKNGTVFYTSTVAPTYPLLVDTTFYNPGGTINNVVLSGNLSGGSPAQNVNWANTIGVSVSSNNLTKNAAAYTWGDSGASSMQSIVSGDGYVEVTASETTTARSGAT